MAIARLEAVLLDIDGTLVDSNDAHAHAWVDALTAAGHDVTFDRIRWLIGKGGDKLLPEVTGIDIESERGKELAEQRTKIFKQKYFPKLQAFPGAKALLARMHRDGLRLVAATSAKEEEMGALLEKTGAADLFYRATSSDEADRSKPDPDIIHAALHKARCRAAAAIMLGDTPYDIDAANGASVRAVALRAGGWPDEKLRGAIAIYDNPESLLAQYDSSPFARSEA
ncbi:MAG TPA: HAD family hydrolase [Polyangiaceae bacterium]|jgi:HAD superfamily hydrolase (TIGR01549 family)|nr:HAD family hydrolase [Polyangiaceae bacterium]